MCAEPRQGYEIAEVEGVLPLGVGEGVGAVGGVDYEVTVSEFGGF